MENLLRRPQFDIKKVPLNHVWEAILRADDAASESVKALLKEYKKIIDLP